MSGFSMDQIYAGSVISVPQDTLPIVDQIAVVDTSVDVIVERMEQMEQYIGNLESQQEDLEQSLKVEQEKEPQLIIKEVRVPVVETRTVVVHESVPANSSTPQPAKSVPVSGNTGVQSASGEMVVKDQNCSTGYALVNPRLQRRCARDGDFM
ncbi:MAG: hypothetical protein P1V18_05110 [Candidatus Gracilibacteria bacterium]|nr:hypothetical protein [Candidatus Gracilibacteria bacterium]